MVMEDQVSQSGAPKQIQEPDTSQVGLPDEERARQAMDRLPAIYALYDAERRIQFVSKLGLRLSGLDEKEVVGRRDEQVLPDEVTGCYLPVLQRAFEFGTPQRAQVSLPASLGGRTAVLDCVPIRDQDGRLTQMLAVATDTTRQKRAAQQLTQANITLEQQVQKRTEQLRMLTLELSQAQEQERQWVAQELHEHLQQALVAGQVQLGLGRQTSGSRAWEFLDQVDQVLQEAIHASRDLAAELSPPILCDADLPMSLEWLGHWVEEKHHLPVQVTVSDQIKVAHEGLRTFLFRTAKDLLTAVVRYADAPRARLNLEQRGDEVWLTVQFPGTAIDIEQNAESDGARALLSIREHAEYLGGHLDIVHTSTRGTNVTFRLDARPYAALEAPSETPAEEKVLVSEAVVPTPRIRILIADDHRIVRQGLVMVLQSEADIAVVGEADNGQQALEMARRLNPDVVLMDMSMPLMDGVQATERIRQDLPDTHVIGLSMYTEKAMMARMRAAGVSAYVNKGGDPAELLRIVRKIVGTQVS